MMIGAWRTYLACMVLICAAAPGLVQSMPLSRTSSILNLRVLTEDVPESRPVILVAEQIREINGHQLIAPEQMAPSSASNPDVFATLHRERLWAIDQTQLLHEKLLRYAGISHEKPMQVPTISETEYNFKVSELDGKVKQNERIQSDSTAPEGQRNDATLELLDLTRQKARLDLRMEESRALTQAQTEFTNLLKEEAATKAEYDTSQHYLYTIDDTINGLLVTTEKSNNFRLWIGAAFTILIGLLISGFFAIAWRDESIKDTFLSNDRGLQFITLFSLIIAIILFGVMNILEGKELSALLGGLSGYILGRSNFGQAHTKEAKRDA
jgi:hypothetical protein